MSKPSDAPGVAGGREDGVSGGPVTIDLDADDGRVSVVDPVRRKREAYAVDPPAGLARGERVDPGMVPAPVGAAVRFRARELDLNRVTTLLVRDADWGSVVECGEGATERFDPGSYVVEVLGPIKVYLHVEGSFAVVADGTSVRLRFDGDAGVVLGARSLHTRPSATVTVPEDPEGVMRGIAAFGSALKTTSPERSWPTLRGHPPAIAVGDALSIPPGLSVPDTGVRLVVPPEHGFAFSAAPLSYYLAADLVPGGPPRLEAETGDGTFVRPLWTPDPGGSDADAPGVDPAAVDWSRPSPAARRAFEAAVERTLRHVHFVEVLIRDRGLYDFPLSERKAVGEDLRDALRVDPSTLYHMASADRLPHYFGVEYDRFADQVPEWEMACYLPPATDRVELLPYVVADLSFVRTHDPSPSAIEDRSGTGEPARSGDRTSGDAVGVDPAPASGSGDAPGDDAGSADEIDDFLRGSTAPGGEPSVVAPVPTDELPEADVLEFGWGGSGKPLGATKLKLGALEERARREPSGPPLTVLVVCNNREMAAERSAVDAIYGDGSVTPFEVRTATDASTDRLEELLATGADLFHYIGHGDDEGLRCPDGHVDVADLAPGDVAVETFLLNACNSYRQGMALLDAGGVGGIVTRETVTNAAALEAGRTIAGLLNAGFPLRAAAEVVTSVHVGWHKYLLVGAGGHALAQRNTPTAPLYRISRGEEWSPEDPVYRVGGEAWPTFDGGPGAVFRPHVSGADYFLVGGPIPPVEVSRSDLEWFLSHGNYPVRIAGEEGCTWNSELTVADVDRVLER